MMLCHVRSSSRRDDETGFTNDQSCLDRLGEQDLSFLVGVCMDSIPEAEGGETARCKFTLATKARESVIYHLSLDVIILVGSTNKHSTLLIQRGQILGIRYLFPCISDPRTVLIHTVDYSC